MANKRDETEVGGQGLLKARPVRARTARLRLIVEEASGRFRPASDSEVLRAAHSLLKRRLRRGRRLPAPQVFQQYLRLAIGSLEHEVFYLVLLDAQQRLIVEKVLFRGTATQSTVYLREVVKEALAANASAVIFAHNHPSRSMQPSTSDRALTQALKTALALVDISVLDHFLVTDQGAVSMAALGMIQGSASL